MVIYHFAKAFLISSFRWKKIWIFSIIWLYMQPMEITSYFISEGLTKVAKEMITWMMI